MLKVGMRDFFATYSLVSVESNGFAALRFRLVAHDSGGDFLQRSQEGRVRVNRTIQGVTLSASVAMISLGPFRLNPGETVPSDPNLEAFQ